MSEQMCRLSARGPSRCRHFPSITAEERAPHALGKLLEQLARSRASSQKPASRASHEYSATCDPTQAADAASLPVLRRCLDVNMVSAAFNARSAAICWRVTRCT